MGGDYRAAAAGFAAAVRSDPSFQAAREHQQAAEAHRRCRRHPAMSLTVVEAVSQITAPPEPASVGALQHVTTDVSQTITDVTGQSGLTST